MRSGGWTVLAIAAVAAIGLAVCNVFGIQPYLREMLVAGLGTTVVCGVALLPLLLTRGAGQLAVVQAGLFASAIHLLGSVLVASSILMRGLIATYPLLIWLAAFFAATLITLTISIAQHVRKAAANQSTNTTNTASNHA
jgi:hypothetical protein